MLTHTCVHTLTRACVTHFLLFRSQECTLILTEGDSAKALAVAGLSLLGDYYDCTTLLPPSLSLYSLPFTNAHVDISPHKDVIDTVYSRSVGSC